MLLPYPFVLRLLMDYMYTLPKAGVTGPNSMIRQILYLQRRAPQPRLTSTRSEIYDQLVIYGMILVLGMVTAWGANKRNVCGVGRCRKGSF